MITIQNPLTFTSSYPPKRLGAISNLLFFDIETTGFSGDYASVYLIGCVWHDGNTWILTQYFAETRDAEEEVLDAFFALLPLLLDEHTAALDPATAEKVLEITKNTVEENHLTCMMITHNMQSALELGNRTVMMNAGKIILDVTGEERAHMTVADLLDRFKQAAGKALDNDRMLLSEAE